MLVEIPEEVMDDSYVNIDSNLGMLYVKKHSLQPPTTFHLKYHNYVVYSHPSNTDTGERCGYVLYNFETGGTPFSNAVIHPRQ